MGALKTPASIVLDRVALSFGERSVVANLSGRFGAGSLTALVGPNGAGKTTLLRAIAGLHPLTSGRIDRLGSRIALLPQGSALDRSFPITCLETVALASPDLGPFRGVGRAQRAAARAALARVGLAGLGDRTVRALSAGQFQRLLFARCIQQNAGIILLDEPFSAVDETTVSVLRSVLRDWHADGRTLIVVLHDMDLVHDDFPETLMLTGRGDAIWGPTASVLQPRQKMSYHTPVRSAA